jgi:hypothetical protein
MTPKRRRERMIANVLLKPGRGWGPKPVFWWVRLAILLMTVAVVLWFVFLGGGI